MSKVSLVFPLCLGGLFRLNSTTQMTRALQDRLTLANIKISRGWEHRSIDSIEPELELELKRKRTESNADISSDASSVISGHIFSAGNTTSSPVTNPVYSDDLLRSGASNGSVKRRRTNMSMKVSSFSGRRSKLHFPQRSTSSWKSSYNLPESSPIRRPRHLKHAASFASETSTIVDDSPSISEDDDQDIPIHSFQYQNVDSTQISSSPPRTPSPSASRSSRVRVNLDSSPSLGLSSHHHPGKEGADLLLYLASSPSPAVHGSKTPRVAPATPPAKSTPLPSSLMTPGGQALFGFMPHTPSNGFNFADFVNVTPSPAQAAFSRTPGPVKTPVAAREARRHLNSEGVASPKVGLLSAKAEGSGKRREGLGMQLGGEL